jgi:formamidopyrimidine-DNA glycosylase
MPEGPELATSRDQLRKYLVGKTLGDVLIVGGRFEKTPPEGLDEILGENILKPMRIDAVDTKGKFMWWTIGPWKMWCTYGMSGQWSTRRGPHTAATVTYEDSYGSQYSLHFNDQRRFGTIKFVKDDGKHKKKLASLGPDVLGNELTPEVFAKNLLVKPARPICEALMDQSCVSGVGNYIRAEAMWLARVNPWLPASELSSKQFVDLFEAATSVSKNSYSSGGATIHTYESPEGKGGEYSSRFVVYGRKTDADGNTVLNEKDSNGRTVHWSPNRQQ